MKLNVHFFITFFVACIAFSNDILIYLFNIEYLNSLLLCSILNVLVFSIILYKKQIKITSDFDKFDILFWILAITVIFINGIFTPDKYYDTSSYHIYLQETPFIDKINFDFFPGRIFCICLFPLGDRMHYIFRYFLGYRLGTIFSYYLMIVLYYQTKIILKNYTNNSKLCSFFSNLIFFINILSSRIGNYYVDNLVLVFTIQIFLILKVEKKYDKNIVYLLCLLSGISIGIKITSVFFIIAIFIFFIIMSYKKIDYKKINIVCCVILGIIPWIIYIVDNYKQTGSILFPYYNSIFKSEYFGLYNWVDPRFGIGNIFDKILWPIVRKFI